MEERSLKQKAKGFFMRAPIILVIVLYGAISYASGIEMVMEPPRENLRAGEVTEFAVYFCNSGHASSEVRVPDRISCRLRAGAESLEVTAYRVGSTVEDTVTICGGCFRKIRYKLSLPPTMTGTVIMSIPGFEGTSTVFAVGPRPSQQASRRGDVEQKKFETLDSLYELYQPYMRNIMPYEPMYFLVGTDPKKSKFQISLKYRLFDPQKTLTQEHPWMKGFHFAYTQTSFWDLKSASKPFEDTSYKPEFFFLSPNIGNPWTTGLFVKGGFQHESNGRGGDASRSTNYVYVTPISIAYSGNSGLGVMVAPKIWAYIDNDDDTNPDLRKYRGYFDLETKIGKADGLLLGSHFRWAEKGPSVELDLTYPLGRYIFKDLNLYFQVQYVNALAESLLNFRDRTRALRLGVAIVR